MLDLQTKRQGKVVEANKPTGQEFIDCLKKVIATAEAKLVAKHPWAFARQGLLWSFDNDPIHTSKVAKAALDALGITARRLPLSPSSPDMHKTIEHCFATLSNALQDYLAKEVAQPIRTADAAYWQQVVRDLWFKVITPQHVQRDIRSLKKDTYKWIIQHEGAYPPSKLR